MSMTTPEASTGNSIPGEARLADMTTTTALLTRTTVELAERMVDQWFYGDVGTESVDQFLSERIDARFQGAVDDDGGRRIRTEQNQFIQLLLDCIDGHPLAVRDGDAASLRRVAWKHSGIVCDDFSKLDIRTGVRFDSPEGGNLATFNPRNITILTGGKKIFITGLRGDTYLDGSGKIVIYGAFNCAAGVSIFTHDHEFRSPDKSLFGQGRSFSNTVIYPECFIGEGAFVFGNLNVRNILAPKTITRLKMPPPPCGVIGGVGSGYGVKRVLDAPASFPVDYLSETVENVRRFSAKHGAHLEKYAEVVREFLATDRRQWAPYQARITALEAALFDGPADRAD
jgi:hypothetical protein